MKAKTGKSCEGKNNISYLLSLSATKKKSFMTLSTVRLPHQLHLLDPLHRLRLPRRHDSNDQAGTSQRFPQQLSDVWLALLVTML